METLYEGEITKLLDTVRASLSSLREDKGSDELTQLLTTDINRLSQTIKQLDVEVRTSANASTRKALQERVKAFKRDARSLDLEFKKLQEAGDRQNLMGMSQAELEQSERMRAINDKIDQSTESLQNSQQVMLDLEDSANDVSSQVSSSGSGDKFLIYALAQTKQGNTDVSPRKAKTIKYLSWSSSIVIVKNGESTRETEIDYLWNCCIRRLYFALLTLFLYLLILPIIVLNLSTILALLVFTATCRYSSSFGVNLIVSSSFSFFRRHSGY